MTLGKVERFWQNVWEEFLCRAQFDSFESARERVRFWVQYYNHRRPHQGIGGLCPADRFFEVRHDLRKVMEQGIAENVKELALRGRAQRPFYLVGRLDKQSVVMRAEKGRLVMTVNDDETREREELVCNLNDGKVEQNGNPQEGQAHEAELLGGGQVAGGSEPVDGAAVADRAVPRAGGVVDGDQPVAGAGDGGAPAGAGAEAEGAGRPDPAVDAAAGPAGAQPGAHGAVRAAGGDGAAGEGGADAGGAAGEAGEGGIDAALAARVLRMLADGTLDRYVKQPPAGHGDGSAQPETE